MSFTSPDKAKLFLRSWLMGKSYYSALDAMAECFNRHNGLRKDGVTPEWFHQVSIALYLITLADLEGILEDLLVTVFLHDMVEDTDISLDEIDKRWGPLVRGAVFLLSKKGIKSRGVLTSERYYEEMSDNVLAALVKGADRINNIQTMQGVFTKEKQIAYMKEAEDNLLPMLKEARNKFPSKMLAFENLKHMLLMQMKLIQGDVT